jgi:hypothetical protein
MQDQFIKADYKVGVQESTVENAEAQTSPNEFEIIQMFRIDARCWIDLESVVVVCRILEEAVEGVEHFV